MSNRLLRACVLALVSALGLAFAPRTALPQVGHAPDRSPYRDLNVRHALMLQGGYLSGSGGRAGAGPTDGGMLGLRYSIHLGGPMEAIFGVGAADLQRVVHNPAEPPDTVSQSAMITEAGFGFLLTGEKTWHGLVPYVAATMGAAFGGTVPSDTSGFSFQTKFHFGPQLGIRWYATPKFSLRIEGRDMMWRLRYPNSYFTLVSGSTVFPPLLQGIDPTREWTHNLSLALVLGLTIRN